MADVVLLCDCPHAHDESLFLDWIYEIYFLELMAPSPMMKGEIQLLNFCVLPLLLLLFYASTWCLFIKLARSRDNKSKRHGVISVYYSYVEICVETETPQKSRLFFVSQPNHRRR